ncbi:MAG: YqhV family protein [Bacillota bacterium]
MFLVNDKFVFGMALIRILSGTIELCAAMLMLKYSRVDTALKINSVLALIGPMVLFSVTALGLSGLAGKISLPRMMMIILGVGLIFYAVNRK